MTFSEVCKNPEVAICAACTGTLYPGYGERGKMDDDAVHSGKRWDVFEGDDGQMYHERC